MDRSQFEEVVQTLSADDDRQKFATVASRLLNPRSLDVDTSARDVLRNCDSSLLSNPETSDQAWFLLTELSDQWIVNSTDIDCLIDLADWLDANNAPVGRALRLANRIAWSSRGMGTPVSSLLASGRDSNSVGSLFLVATLLERRRFLFQGKQILRAISELSAISNLYLELTYVRAMKSFALLLAGGKRDIPQALELNDLAWNDTSQIDSVGAIRDICLHGLWVGNLIPNQGELLLRRCDEYVEEAHRFGLRPDNAIVLFRRAGAQRMLALFEESIETIDELLNGLSGSSEFIRTFSEQIIRERELAQLGLTFEKLRSDVDGAAVRLAEAEGKLNQSEARLGEIEHQGLTRNVQIISIFTAAVAFAVGVAGITTKSGNAPLSAVLISVSLGVGLLGFVFLIFLVTRTREEVSPFQNQKKLTWTVITSFLALMVSIIAVAGTFIGRGSK